jgi:DNA-binding CsgD family transcriptional regulator
MLGACPNYRSDNECRCTTRSSPPYQSSCDRPGTHDRWNQVTDPAPTLLTGRTTVQAVSWNALPDGPRTSRGFEVGDYPVVAPETCVLPEAAELQRRFHLTEREAEVAVLLARRRTNKEIARMLNVTSHTAKRHVENVLRKLSVNSRFRVLGAITSAPGTQRVRSRSMCG